MNISLDGVIRSLVGGASRSEGRALELKPGQLVQGTVTRTLEGNEAMVSINGVSVKAKLETTLPAGQPTLMQVQPDPTGQGQIVLKPHAGGQGELTNEAAKAMLRNWGMEPSSDNRAMLRLMAREGVPLTPDHLRAALDAWQGMPKGTPMSDAARALSVALARQLPLSAATLQALQATLSGPAAHELLERLAGQLDRLAGGAAGGGAGSEAARALAGKLADAVRAVWTAAGGALAGAGADGAAATVRPGAAGGGAAAAASTAAGSAAAPAASAQAQSAGGGAAAAQATPGAPMAAGAAGAGGAAGATAAPTAGPAAAAGAAPQAAAGPAPTAGMTQQPVATQPAAALAPGAPPLPAEPAAPAAGSAAAAGQAAAARAGGETAGAAPSSTPSQQVSQPPVSAQQPARGEAQAAANSTAAQSAAARPAAQGWLPQLLHRLGFDWERTVARMGTALPVAGGADAEPQAAVESLKQLLLHASSSDDLPAALRDTAKQLLQQVTGQQLLYSGDKQSGIVHQTFFVPLQLADGSKQTATIHVESRKGREGQVDAANCRLLFDLRLAAIGETIVDVHVAERFVSLHIYNDWPPMGAVLEQSREKLAESLTGLGYSCAQLKVSRFPEDTTAAADAADVRTPEETSGSGGRTKLAEYMQGAYRGVDMRV